MENQPKGFYIPKKLSVPAKIVGLYYNTFFQFCFVAGILVMMGSAKGLWGMVGMLPLLVLVYLVLLLLQTKIGLKEFAKRKANYFNPIDNIKIKIPISRKNYNGLR